MRFVDEVAAQATALFVLGDLFDYWIGPAQLRDRALQPVLAALRALGGQGCALTLLHGNRDFLLGGAESRALAARIPGEETAERLFGRRYLLLHGDSLCTRDVAYQRAKPWLRSRAVRGLSRILPGAVSHAIARRLRAASRRSVAAKPQEEMEIVPAAAARRFAEGHDALICGHVHRPGLREVPVAGGVRPLYVLSDWSATGGVHAAISASGVELIEWPGGG